MEDTGKTRGKRKLESMEYLLIPRNIIFTVYN